jgi:hypothetical protein
MLLYPWEAKRKWCPFGRTPQAADLSMTPAINRKSDGTPDDGSLCVADDCMAWRRHNYTSEHGYCGLAGAPARSSGE